MARSPERAAITCEFEYAPLAVINGVLSVWSGTALYAVDFTVNVFVLKLDKGISTASAMLVCGFMLVCTGIGR